MSDTTIVREWGDTRLIIKPQLDGIEIPYDEGSFPVVFRFYFNRGRFGEAVQVTEATDYVVDAGLIRAFDSDRRIFERYAGIFFGARTFAYRESHAGIYCAFDTAEWRERQGLTDDYIAAHFGGEGQPTYEANFGQFGDYLDDNVWSVHVQKKCAYNEWHDVDAVYGFYCENDDEFHKYVLEDYWPADAEVK